MEKLPVSVIVAVFQEEACLQDCLKSVDWAAEVIVVDGGSTDRTREIARDCGAKVLVESNGPAETQRLKGLKQMSEPWFLLLDADERISRTLRDSIADVIKQPNAFNSYRILRRNYCGTRAVHFQHPDFQIRFFRSSEVGALPEKIHRTPHPSGKVGFLQGELTHLFFTTWAAHRKKLEFYTSIEAQYWRETGRDIRGLDILKYLWFRPAARFFQYYFLRKGFLDGWFGLRYAWGGGYYEWAVAKKVLDAGSKTIKPICL